MEIKQIEYFLKVVEKGSFSEAAAALFISQSSLSKQILSLEKELSFPLFDRSRRRIALTPAGEEFLKHARLLENEYAAMLADVKIFQTSPKLSIAAFPVIAQYGILIHITRFKQLHPEIELSLEEREAAEIFPAMNNGQYDLALTRDNYLDNERFDSLEVLQDHLVAVLSRQHRLAGKPEIDLAELRGENFIMFDKGTLVHELARDACRQAGFEPHIFYASLRVESILSLVAANSGVALMMKKVVDYHQNPDLVQIPLKENVESRVVIAWPRHRKLSISATRFIEFLKKSAASRKE